MFKTQFNLENKIFGQNLPKIAWNKTFENNYHNRNRYIAIYLCTKFQVLWRTSYFGTTLPPIKMNAKFEKININIKIRVIKWIFHWDSFNLEDIPLCDKIYLKTRYDNNLVLVKNLQYGWFQVISVFHGCFRWFQLVSGGFHLVSDRFS